MHWTCEVFAVAHRFVHFAGPRTFQHATANFEDQLAPSCESSFEVPKSSSQSNDLHLIEVSMARQIGKWHLQLLQSTMPYSDRIAQQAAMMKQAAVRLSTAP